MPGLASAPAIRAVAIARDLQIQTITALGAFVDLEPVWNDLLKRANIDHPFLEHAWIRTWWESFGGGSSLNILLVMAGDEPVAIAPLMLTKIRMYGIAVRRLGLLYNEHVPRADFIVASGRDEAYAAIWRYLCQNRTWDLLQLCQLPEHSRTLSHLQALALQSNFRTGIWKSGSSPFVLLQEGWTSYYDGLAAKHRSNLRNRFKRLNQVGPVELETADSPELLEGPLEEGLKLEAAAWKREAGTAISSNSEVAGFYRAFAQRAAERGWLRLNFLRSGATRVAFDYSLSYRNSIFLLKLGYDPAFSAYSPSNLLLSLALKDAFDGGYAMYDFLGEEADWKGCWTKGSASHAWLFILPDSFRGSLLYLIKFHVIPLGKGALRALRSAVARLVSPVARWKARWN